MLLVSTWSRPFVKATVVLLFIGTGIGSAWMLMLSGYSMGIPAGVFALHREFQTGAITLLIMGVMYMLVPRIRSIRFTNVREARISFVLMIASLVMQSSAVVVGSSMILVAAVTRLTAVALFSLLVLLMLRVAPRSGRLADHYFTLSLSMLIAYSALHTAAAVGMNIKMEPLNLIYIWMASVIFTIFGVQYKVVPVFFNQSSPMRGVDLVAFISALTSASMLVMQLFAAAVAAMMVSALAFAYSIYLMRRLTIPGFLYTSQDPQATEKIARLRFFATLLRVAYIALLLGLINALLYATNPTFHLYDLAIHMVTMGFIGITIMNFMPIMLPPIVGRNVNYTRFNMIPLIVLLSAIALRVSWNLMPYMMAVDRVVFGISGLVTVAAMILYINMIHASMDPPAHVEG
ncbi:MAG: hypothetical protein RMJ59_03355 [Candidatus Nitrosocaldus sp.]|nr:hypothetical protein [Candidatus Nitrosocaldus sp.]MDW8275404.1 hypothetical protein [Candidatus Nitrosocaldus sp.]